MATVGEGAARAVRRLGVIGDHEWWHCRICGDVWQTARAGRDFAASHAASEVRRHTASHGHAQAGRALRRHAPALRSMNEKHR